MKVYLVKGLVDMEVAPSNFVEYGWTYGIFSSKEKADEIVSKLRKNISQNNEHTKIAITEMELNKPTDDYYLAICNFESFV